MSTLPSISQLQTQRGSALVIAIVTLVILGALGLAALDVADLNLFISANDRDAKETFFHADAGVNVGHEFLEDALDIANSTFYGNNATDWLTQTVEEFNSTSYPLNIYATSNQATSIRSGILARGFMEGSAIQIGAGYEGAGKSAAHGGTFTNFLIRSHREGARNSVAEVDMGWRHIN